MTDEEQFARTEALERQLMRTIEGHVDSLDDKDAATIACVASMATLVQVALYVSGEDVARAVAMIRNAPWDELVPDMLGVLRERARERASDVR